MLLDVITVGLIVGLGALVYLMRRQSGVVLLAMLAGALLASGATQAVTAWVTAHGFEVTMMKPEAAVGVALVLAPAVLALVAAPKGHGKWRRLVGALVFGVVGATLLAQFFAGIFASGVLHDAQLSPQLDKWRAAIIAIGIGYALLELLTSRKKSGGDDEKAKK